MALKQYRPTTPGQRQLVLIDRSGLFKGAPVKALTEGQTRHGGRNNTGRVTVRWQGGGHKQRYRIIDFKRRKFDMPAVVERLEYDPNRTSFIALLKYKDGEQSYIIAPQRIAVGDSVISGEKVDVKPGNAMKLAALLRPLPSKVNLIPLNESKEWLPGLARPADAVVNAFAKAVADGGVPVTVRWSKGLQADAACGQLKGREEPRRPAPLTR